MSLSRFRPFAAHHSHASLLLTLAVVGCSGGVEIGPTAGLDGGDGGYPTTVDAGHPDALTAPLDGGHDARSTPIFDSGSPFIPDGGAAPIDAMKVTAPAPHGEATVDAGSARDSGSTPDDATDDAPRIGLPDAPVSHDAKLPDAHPSWPDAAGIAVACETCLDSTCGADVAACEADPTCEASIECAVESGCLAAGASGIEECVEACITTAGLTAHEELLVVQEITAISQCATPCLTACDVGDAGK